MRDMTRVWGGRTVAERTAERRAAVLKAAIDIVGESGTSAMTTKAVCARAGVAERRLYESFDSRDALLREVFDACLARGTELVADAFMRAPDAGLLERLRNTLIAGVDAAVDDPAMIRVLFVEAASDPVLRERSQTMQLALEALVAQLLTGDIEGVDAADFDAATATFVIGGFITAFTAWRTGRIEMTREEVVESAMRALVRVLGLDRAHDRGQYADG